METFISSVSNTGYGAPVVATISIAVAAGTLMWGLYKYVTTPPPPAAPPPPPPPSIPLNPQEMDRLSQAQEVYQQRINDLSSQVAAGEAHLQREEQQLGISDRMFNTERAQQVSQIRQQVETNKRQLTHTQGQAQTTQYLQANTERTGQVEYRIQNLRERTANAWTTAQTSAQQRDAQWNRLNMRQKTIYAIPTATLRAGAGRALMTGTEEVETYIQREERAAQNTQTYEYLYRETDGAYQDLIGTMHRNIQHDPTHNHDRSRKQKLIQAHTLARRLKQEADATNSAISSYRFTDNLSTMVEVAADNARTPEERDGRRQLASLGRLSATWDLATVTDHLDRMQTLANELDALAKELETNVDTQGIQSTQLDGASSSMWAFNIAELFGSNRGALSLPLNIAEYFNNESIVSTVTQMGRAAEAIGAQLITPAISIFEQERSLLRNQEASTLEDAERFREHARTYLQHQAA